MFELMEAVARRRVVGGGTLDLGRGVAVCRGSQLTEYRLLDPTTLRTRERHEEAEVSSNVTLGMLVLMLGALFGGLLNRWHGKVDKDGLRRSSSITHRFIQFVGVAWLVGGTLILAMEKVIDSSVVATIFGALAGYLFAMERHDGMDKKTGGRPGSG